MHCTADRDTANRLHQGDDCGCGSLITTSARLGSCSQRLEVLEQRILLDGGERRSELVPLVAAALRFHVQARAGALRFRPLRHEADVDRIVEIIAAPEYLGARRRLARDLPGCVASQAKRTRVEIVKPVG